MANYYAYTVLFTACVMCANKVVLCCAMTVHCYHREVCLHVQHLFKSLAVTVEFNCGLRRT